MTSSPYPLLHLNAVSSSELATVDQQGTVRMLESGYTSLERLCYERRAFYMIPADGALLKSLVIV